MMKRSPNRMANWALAMPHSRGGIFHSFVGIVQDQERQLQRGLVGGEVAAGPDGAAQLGVQGLDGVRGVDDPADVLGKGEERDHALPVPPPGLGDGRVFAAPGAGLEGLERGLAGLGVAGPVDRPSAPARRLAVLVGDEVQRVADQVHDAGLDLSPAETRR